MDKVLRHVVIAVGDENLLAENLEAAVCLRLGARAHGGEVRAGARLGQIHRTGPHATDHFFKVSGFYFIGAGECQCFDGAGGEQRAKREGMVRRLPHFGDGCTDELGQALAAPLRLTLQRCPAAIGKQLVGFLEALRHGHGLVVPLRAFPVTRNIQRRKHALGKLGGFLKHRVDKVRRRLFATR